MKKVIFFSKDLSIGGMEKALVNLLNRLIDYYDITLVLENVSGEYLTSLDKRIKLKEYKISNNKIVVLRKITNFIKRLLWKLKYQNKYDFSCNYATYLIWASKLAQISSKKSSYYIHSNYYEVFNHNDNKIKLFFDAHNLEYFKYIIFVSNEGKDGFLKVYPGFNNTLVINNLIDYKNIIESSKKEKNLIDKNKTNFTFIGRLDNDSKNLDLLLESFLLAHKTNNNIMLNIIGDGLYREKLLSTIAVNKMEEYVNYIGAKTNPYPYLKESDALILTSNYEGYPVVYLEALVLNKPIFTTIITSDEEINIKDYCIKLEKNKNDIAKKINEYTKKEYKYGLNFDKINTKRVNAIRSIIEE